MAFLWTLLVLLLSIILSTADNIDGNGALPRSSELPSIPQITSGRSMTEYCVYTKLLTFDDISVPLNSKYTAISSQYGGLTWSNVYILNTTWEQVNYGWNGYQTGRNSGTFIAFNGGGSAMSMSVSEGQYFQLNSMYLAAAWHSNLIVTIKGFRQDVLYYQTTVQLQVTSKTALYMLKWSNIDTVTFTATGGTQYPGLRGTGTSFVLDDLEISI